jgi:hypothetical protein
MEYFPLQYRLHGEERFLIWISGEKDTLAMDSGRGSLQSFPSLIALRQYAGANGWPIEDEDATPHDLDAIASWVASPETPLDCEEALLAWNLFCDVANSVTGDRKSQFETLDSQLGSLYEKLLLADNLPAVAPEGKPFAPTLSQDEVRSIAALLSAGLKLFVSCTLSVPHESRMN